MATVGVKGLTHIAIQSLDKQLGKS